MSATRNPEDRRWLALGVLCLSLLLVVLDNTILNVALPTLVDELDASTSDLQWIVDSYVLVFAGLLLSAGSLGDRYGRRRSLFAGMAIFGIGSVLAAFSGSCATLIATRAFMGLGAAFVMPATLSIITNLFTDPKERAQAIAAWAGVAGLGVAIGPITGGWLLEHFWWGSVFLVNVPFIVLALVAGRRLLPESRDPEQPRLDFVGAVLSIVGLTALVWTVIEAPHHGWTDAVTLGGLAAAAAVLGAFIAWERHTDHPMLDLGFFTDRRFSVGTGSITLVMFAMFGSLFILTQLLQFVFGYTALEAGIRMLPIAGTMVVVAPSSAKLVERLGTKLVVGTGMAIIAVGLVLTSSLSPADGYGPRGLRHGRARHGHGAGDGPGDRGDHGLAAAGQGRCRLGRERHHPGAGRRPRRGRARQHPVVGLRHQRGRRPRRHPGTRRGEGGGRRVARRGHLGGQPDRRRGRAAAHRRGPAGLPRRHGHLAAGGGGGGRRRVDPHLRVPAVPLEGGRRRPRPRCWMRPWCLVPDAMLEAA